MRPSNNLENKTISDSYWRVQLVCMKVKGALSGLRQWKPFKNDEKSFLFHLKSCFRSQDI